MSKHNLGKILISKSPFFISDISREYNIPYSSIRSWLNYHLARDVYLIREIERVTQDRGAPKIKYSVIKKGTENEN